jgi:hypothetical protein
VFYYQKMEVENFQNDIILAEACRKDVESFCASVEPGTRACVRVTTVHFCGNRLSLQWGKRVAA